VSGLSASGETNFRTRGDFTAVRITVTDVAGKSATKTAKF
jgi:hypothetical protein